MNGEANNEHILEYESILDEGTGMKTYKLKKTLLFFYDPKIKIFSIGKENDYEIKNIFLMGATGVGKTRLLNALVNHIFGVTVESEYRYTIKDEIGEEQKNRAESQTEYVVGYLIFVPPEYGRNCNYLIIDTPGLKDSKGFQRELEVISQIQTFLKDVDGVEELHCIGFVVKSSTTRIQQQFKYIVDEFCKMFGENAMTVIRIFISFHDYSGEPHAIDVLEHSCLKGCKNYVFNNGILYNSSTNISEIGKFYWKKTSETYESFFQEIDNINPVSLSLTRETLEEISSLKSTIDRMTEVVESYVNVMISLNEYEDECKEYQRIMKANEQWQGTIQVKRRRVSKNLSRWMSIKTHAHNCERCVQTCKYPCDDVKGLVNRQCPKSEEICSKCPCTNGSHEKSSQLIYHVLEDEPIIHEDKKALYDEALQNESCINEKIRNQRLRIDEKQSIADARVLELSDLLQKIKEKSLSHRENTVEELIDDTLNTVKLELLESTETEKQGYISPAIENLHNHIYTLLSSN